jgi:hypothetical protein
MPAEPVEDGLPAADHELRRELARRTAEVAALRAEVAALAAQLAGNTLELPEVSEWRAKAAEYDALMATKTMHAVRIPRAIYGRILARRAHG